MTTDPHRGPQRGARGRARRFSRRTFLAGLAGAAGAGGTAAALLLTRRNSAVPSASGATPTTIATDSPPEEASPTPAATPSPAPPRGLELIEPAPNAFESVVYGNGQAIDWIYGIFFMDTTNGTVRGYRLPADGRRQPRHARHEPRRRSRRR